MSTTRTDFTFRVDTWPPDGKSIVEHVAGVEDYQVALATYRAACERRPAAASLRRADVRALIVRTVAACAWCRQRPTDTGRLKGHAVVSPLGAVGGKPTREPRIRRRSPPSERF